MSVLDKRTRNDPRRQATERAFLDAAEALLDEGASFADLNVSRIAERAGRTRTAFYVHFEDRRELLIALMDNAGADAVTALEPFLLASESITYDALTESTAALLAAFREHSSLVRAVIEVAGYDAPIAARWNAIVGRIIDGARARLEKDGVGAQEAKATATALVWMTERCCYQQAAGDGTGLDDALMVKGIADAWWHTIQAQRGDAEHR